ncbi:MAG: AEC family transporter [Alphaproteobacteria bacterium]
MSAEIFAIIAPVLICAGIGFGWVKLKVPYDTGFVTNLATTLGAPALIFSTLIGQAEGVSGLIDRMADMALASIAAIGAMLAVGAIVLYALRLPFSSYLPSLAFSNSGNMGLPLCLFAFGQEGLALAIAYFAVAAILNFTVGVALASGTWSVGRLLRTPIIWAVAASVAVIATGTDLPLWATRTIGLVGQVTIPLMLITLGVSLASLGLRNLPRSVLLALLRLVIGFGVGLAIAWAFDLGYREGGVLIIETTMPVAVFNYLFAQRYARAPEDVAGMVLISTIVSFASLPLLLAYVLERAG